MLRSEGAKVEIDGRMEAVTGAATYRSGEYSLVYKPTATLPEVNAKRSASGAWRQNGRRIFVTAGFVTLTFDGAPFVFTELDAYANDATWIEREIVLPVARGRGALVLTDERLDDDRMSISAEPAFEVDRTRATIRIGFARDAAETYFEIGTALYAGISEGRLSSLILGEVQFV